MECVEQTSRDVTEYLGGICTDDGVKGGIGIPGLDSWLVGFSTDTEVIGLDSVPPDERPPANTLLHLAFDAMVGIGTALMALGIWLGIAWWRKRDIPQIEMVPPLGRRLRVWQRSLRWNVGGSLTEVGSTTLDRSTGVMRTEDAITGASGVWVTFSIVLVLYALLGTATVVVLRRMAERWRETRQSCPCPIRTAGRPTLETPGGPA